MSPHAGEICSMIPLGSLLGPHRRLRVLLTAACLLPLGVVGSGVAGGAVPACLDTTIPGTFEEQLVDDAVPQALIKQAGFTGQATSFARDLCAARNEAKAQAVVRGHAGALWSFATARAQGRLKAGTLSAGDDRPLYWTRLEITRDLRRYRPSFSLSTETRAALIADVDRLSRGHQDITYPANRSIKRVLISGFDPFQLPTSINNANPSGATALALDGRTFMTAKGKVQIQAIVMPVRWVDFARGDFERAFTPVLSKVDYFTTISQGRPSQFDLEVTNGGWRGGFVDNNNLCFTEMVPIAAGTPTVTPQPQWTTSTLPFAAIAKVEGRYRINVNHLVTHLPFPTPKPPTVTACDPVGAFSLVLGAGVDAADGPTPNDTARGGGGGNYLSNEVAYRATLLRDALHLPKLPGGHLHTPVLDGLSNSSQVTNGVFEEHRTAIVEQVQQMLLAGIVASR